MPTNCVVFGCTRTSADKSASFYGFPSINKNPSRRNKWVRFVKSYRLDFTGPGVSHNNNVKICDAHFCDNDFEKRYQLAESLRKEGKFSAKYTRKLTDSAVPSRTFIPGRIGKTPSKATSGNPRRRLSIYCKKSDMRARTHETSLMIAEHQRKKTEESEKKMREFKEKWEAKTTEDAAKHLQRFALMAKPPAQVSQQTLTPSGFSSTETTADQNKCHQGTQVYIKPAKVYYRSKAINVRSTYWGKNKGMQTDLIQVQTKASWTQYEDQTSQATPLVEDTAEGTDMEVEPPEFTEDVSEEEDDKTKDPDYSPLDELRDAGPCKPQLISDIETHTEDSLPHVEPKYLIFERCLLELFQVCPLCNGEAAGEVSHMKGSLVVIKQRCVHKPNCGYTRQWYSQPFIADLPAGNLMLSAAILFAGASPKKVLRVLSSANISCISYPTFIQHQRRYLQPAIVNTWEKMQDDMRQQLEELGQPLVIGGDARNDSPGHTAKYGSYTFMEMSINKVIHVELVQKNEVANSYNMELEALRRGLDWVEQTDLTLGTIITDRHVQVRAWIRENLKDVKHYFDVWHISKGLKKKLRAAGMKKDCERILQWTKSITNHLYWVASSTPDANQELMAAKWTSMTNHIMNIHDHEPGVFPQCLHGPLADEVTAQRIAWIPPDSMAADEVLRICQSTYLMKDIKMMSPAHQTSSVEAYHGTINYFAPKLYGYSHQGMLSRLLLAAMHFNENSARTQRKTKDGTEQWSISWPRGRDSYVLRKVLVNPTYGYVYELLSETTRLALTRNKNLREETPLLCNVPPPLSTSRERPNMEEALEREHSRFAKGNNT